MRKHAAVKYSHTRLELRLEIQRDRRFRHIRNVQAAIGLFGHGKDINQPTGVAETAQVNAFKAKHGYSVSAVYYDPVVTFRNLSEAKLQSCVFCGEVHDNGIGNGNNSSFNIGYPTGYDALCFLCESDFRSYSSRMVKEEKQGTLSDDTPDNVDWNAEWVARQNAKQLAATRWLMLKLKKAIRIREKAG